MGRATIAHLIASFLLAAPASSWAQGIDEPINSGAIIPADTGDRTFSRIVTACGDFQVNMIARHNGVARWSASATIVTEGPWVGVAATIPLAALGLAQGDALEVEFHVQSSVTYHGGGFTVETFSTVIAAVGQGCSAPPGRGGAPQANGSGSPNRWVHLTGTLLAPPDSNTDQGTGDDSAGTGSGGTSP